MRGLCAKPFCSRRNKFPHRIAHDTSAINCAQNLPLKLLCTLILLRTRDAVPIRLRQFSVHVYYFAVCSLEWLATIRTDRSLKVRETPAADQLILRSITVTSLPITEDMTTRQAGWSASAMRRSTTVCFEANITVR